MPTASNLGDENACAICRQNMILEPKLEDRSPLPGIGSLVPRVPFTKSFVIRFSRLLF